MRSVGEVGKLFADAGVVAVVSLISPYRADRTLVPAAHDPYEISEAPELVLRPEGGDPATMAVAVLAAIEG